MVPSRLPLASVCPSGLNATESTAPVPPVRRWPSGLGCAGSATSHSRTVPSRLPLASVCPSGAERHRRHGAAAGQDRAEQAGVRGIGDIPQPDRAVVVAAGQRVPVGAERHRVDRRRRAGQGRAERAGLRGIGDVPQPDRAVEAAAGQRVPVGAERHRLDRRRCRAVRAWPSGRGCAGSATSHSRTRCRRVLAAGQRVPVGAERHRVDGRAARDRDWPSRRGCAGSATSHSRTAPSSSPLASVCPSGLNATDWITALPPIGPLPGCDGQRLAERQGVRGIGDVPQPDRAVSIAAGQHVPVGAERHRVNAPGAGCHRARAGECFRCSAGVRRDLGSAGCR